VKVTKPRRRRFLIEMTELETELLETALFEFNVSFEGSKSFKDVMSFSRKLRRMVSDAKRGWKPRAK